MDSGNINAAKASLQNALSLDFKIRESPVFMGIKAQIEAKNEEWEAAKATLLAAYALPGVKEEDYGEKKASSQQNLPFGIEERAKIYILLIEVMA